MPSPTAPLYIDRRGHPLFRGPYRNRNSRLHCFLLPADYNRLKATCDRYLNPPTDGKLRYVPLLPSVMLTFANIGAISSLDERDRNVGWVPEVDASFWVLTVALQRAGPL